jgi:hypothetical protein
MTKAEAVKTASSPGNIAGACGGKGGCNPTKGARQVSGTPGPGKYVPPKPRERIQEIIK